MILLVTFDMEKENKQLARLVKKMAAVEQELRFSASKHADLGKYLVYVVDGVNGYRVKSIIAQYGYPTQKLLGKEGMEAFWLLVQHQDFDLQLQKDCLENCDFDKKCKAFLLDRILVAEGKRQMYGTQMKIEAKKIEPQPIENEKEVDNLRKAAGLSSLRDELDRIRELRSSRDTQEASFI